MLLWSGVALLGITIAMRMVMPLPDISAVERISNHWEHFVLLPLVGKLVTLGYVLMIVWVPVL